MLKHPGAHRSNICYIGAMELRIPRTYLHETNECFKTATINESISQLKNPSKEKFDMLEINAFRQDMSFAQVFFQSSRHVGPVELCEEEVDTDCWAIAEDVRGLQTNGLHKFKATSLISLMSPNRQLRE